MNVSWFDRALKSFAPRTAARRIVAKAQFEIAERAYAGAAAGRHTDGWTTKSTSADAEISGAGSKLRDRSRDLTRNNPHAAKALSSWVTNVVGDGIWPRTKDQRALELFKAWQKDCESGGQLDWNGVITLCVREMIEGGEVLVRRRNRERTDGLAVPLQVQILESDYLDDTKTGDTSDGRTAVNGVEFNGIGRRTAYWLYAQHPGNNFISFRQRIASAPVPADQVIHLYEHQRTQTRGVPWCTPVLRDLRDLDDWKFAEMLRKKLEACVVGTVLGFDEHEQGVGGPRITDANGKTIEKMQPGMFVYAQGGKDVKFNQPSATPGVADYTRVSLKTIAAGYRMPYELLSGDLSEVNYSSIRAGLLEYRRLVYAVQWQIVIPRLCQQMWDWFTEMAFAAGLLPQPVVAVEWDCPQFEWVDPLKDAMADVLAVRAGIRSLPEVCAARGRSFDDVLKEIIETNKKLDAAEVILDTDPRNTAQSGTLQAAQEAAAAGEDDKPEPKPGEKKPVRGLLRSL